MKINNVSLDGWTLEEFHTFKKITPTREITIEFCLGDYCVGVWEGDEKRLLQPKVRCDTLPEALVKADSLEKIYQE